MKLLSTVAIALLACTDLTSAWRMRLYKGQKHKGATSTKAGKGLPGKACHRISGFKGPNLAGKFKSLKYWPYDPKYKTDCGVYFYRSKNCKAGKGSGYTGFFIWESSSTAAEPYHSMLTTCKKANYKRSELEEVDGDWNTTAAALEALDEEYLADVEYVEDLLDLDDWSASDVVEVAKEAEDSE